MWRARGIILTCGVSLADKFDAKKSSSRIQESSLLAFGFIDILGGSTPLPP